MRHWFLNNAPITRPYRPRNVFRDWQNRWNSFVEIGVDCWNWKGPIGTKGYGQFGANGLLHMAHRFSYELYVEKIPEGFHIHHTCENKRCVNPNHLRVTTPRVNILLGNGAAAINSRKMFCIRGHSLEGDNLYMTPDGKRQCRQCHNTRVKAYNERNKLR